MNQRERRLFIPVIAGSGGTVYANWHYDPDIASSGNGKTLETAFKTWSEVAAVWVAGESVWVEPKDDGTKFRESWIIPGANSSILGAGLYNSITKTWSGGPQVSGADIAANASFSKTGGLTNVYEIAVTVEAGATQFVNVFEDDAYLTRVADSATCDATAGSCAVTAETGNITIYVHASDSSDVTANSKVYEYTKRIRGIYGDSTATGCTLSGIHAEKALGDSGCISLQGAASTMTNVSALQGGNHTLQINPITSSLTSFVVNGGYSGTRAGTLVNFNADVFNGETLTITSGIIKHPSRTVPGWAIMLGLNGHQNTSGALGALAMSDVTFENLTVAVSGPNHTTAVNLTNITYTNNARGINTTSSAPAGGCTYNISGGTWATEVAANMLGYITAGTVVTVVMTGVTLTGSGAMSNGLVVVTAGATVSVTGCTFKADVVGNRVGVYCSSNAANLTLNNNTYNTGAIGWTQHYLFTAGASGMTWASDNNSFELTTDSWSIFGTAYTDFATYQAAVAPNDANSTSS